MQVWWLPSQGRQWVHSKYPNIVLTTKTELTPFEKLKSEHIEKINDDWSTPLDTFRRYQRDNLTINMFFVESVFMYDYAWCVGVDSVTTSNCKLLSKPHTNSFLQVHTYRYSNWLAKGWGLHFELFRGYFSQWLFFFLSRFAGSGSRGWLVLTHYC